MAVGQKIPGTQRISVWKTEMSRTCGPGAFLFDPWSLKSDFVNTASGLMDHLEWKDFWNIFFQN